MTDQQAPRKPIHDEDLWKLRAFPSKISDDEDIVLITREDLIIIFTKGLGLFLIFFAMLIVRTISRGVLDELQMSLFDTLFYGVNVVLILFFTWIFHNYYLSLQIVTSERVIDIDQKGIFNREINELPLSSLEDVSFKQVGFLSTVFNYGNIILQTAGSGGSGTPEAKMNGFTFNNVPNPSSIANTISALYKAEERSNFDYQAHANAQAMVNIMNKSNEL
jgi:Bacterial PH domain